MKRIGLLGLLLACIITTGCNNSSETQASEINDNENIVTNDTNTNNTDPDANNIPYIGTVTIEGIGPKDSGEPTVKDGTLVLTESFEDHTNHLFVEEGLYNCNEINNCEQGTTLIFQGVVDYVDAGAGNRYYNVTKIDSILSATVTE